MKLGILDTVILKNGDVGRVVEFDMDGTVKINFRNGWMGWEDRDDIVHCFPKV